jgi:hypothetical protein
MRFAACLAALTLTLAATTAGTAIAAPAGPGAPVSARSTQVSHDETTVSQNELRDGWDPNEPDLTPSAVGGGHFGQLFATHVNGQVYAQPLVVDNPGTSTTAPGSNVIVATENDSVYSLDGTTGKVAWSTSIGTPWLSSAIGCGDLAPDVGITSTPVYDAATGEVYVVGVVTGGNPSTKTPAIEVAALNEKTGAIVWKTTVHGSPANAAALRFNPAVERQRAGLLLMNGWLYMAFAAYCDAGAYTGYVAGVSIATRAETLWTAETGLASDQAGIWMSGSGLMSDGPGRIFLTTGNGVSPPPGPGTSPSGQLGDSVVRLQVQSNGSLKAADFFSPANAPALDRGDMDFGSGGPVGLPFGTSTYPDLLVQAGKDGRVFLLNAKGLGGRGASTDNPVSQGGPYGGQWGHPAAFAGSGGNDYVYYAGSGEGWSDYLRALQFNGSNPGKPVLTDVANSPGTFGFTAGSPVITSSGTDSSSAIVWEVYSTGATGAGARLDAFDAIPQRGTLKQIWSAPIGIAVKFAVPATDGGRVYVGTRNDGTTGTSPTAGVVYGFGVSNAMPLNGAQADFGAVGVSGPSQTMDVTVTATRPLQVSGISATSTTTPSPFTLGTPSLSLPASLQPGQQLSVPVTFTPATTGAVTGSVQLSTNVPGFATVSVPLAGTGAAPGLAASPSTMAFGDTVNVPNSPHNGPVPVGASQSFPVNIVNTSTTAETIGSVTPPAAPFSLSGIAAGTVLQPGQPVTGTVTYRPTTVTSADSGQFTVTDAGSHSVTVPLTGISEAGAGTLTASATSVNFGNVALGATARSAVTIVNSGNLPVAISAFTMPGAPFGTTVASPVGLTLSPGDDISLPVTFTPQSRGAGGGAYRITASDGVNPAQTTTVAVTGTGVTPASGIVVPSPGGGWTLNGSAAMHGTTLSLTPAVAGQAGSAVYYEPLRGTALNASFTLHASGGTGGDGVTFSLLSPADSPAALGQGGGQVGFGGLAGVSVVLGTSTATGGPSGNFVGIATGASGGHLTFAATSTSVPNLRSGTHVIGVSTSGGKVTVTVDGKAAVSATVAVPSTALAAFTAATGTGAAVQAVTGVSVSSTIGAVPPPGGGWSYNGSAVLSGSDTDLTRAVAHQAGSVIYPRAVSTASLHATFGIQIGGGNGANGMAFALLSPTSSIASVGGLGQGLGLAGLNGIGVALATYQAPGDPSANFVAITVGTSAGQPAIKSSSSAIEPLRVGAHTVTIAVAGGEMYVYLDGAQVLRHSMILTSAFLAFTGGTGGLTDVHAVRNAAIAAGGW